MIGDVFKRPKSIVMSDVVYKAYARDFQNGIVTLGDVCNADCIFCSQKWNPPNVIRTLKRLLTMDEIMHFIEQYMDKVCWIASGLHTNSGEYYIHPNADEILDILYDEGKLPRDVEIFSNGMSLKDTHIETAKKYGLQFNISINSTDIETRKRVMGGSLKTNENAVEAIEKLVKHGVNVRASIVPMRSALNDGDVERTVKDLKRIGIKHIQASRPGYTKCTPPEIVDELKVSDDESIGYFKEIGRKYEMNIGNDALTEDEKAEGVNYRLSLHRERWAEIDKYHKLFLCSRQARDILPMSLKRMSLNNYDIKVVENGTFGGNIDCAGLLLVEDYIRAIDEHIKQGKHEYFEIIILPAIGFDNQLDDLSMMPVARIADKYGAQVIVI